MTTLLIVGASGLVGNSVLQQALVHPQVERIIALTRKPLAPHEKLENSIVDFDNLVNDTRIWAVDSVICTLGTTMHKAGSKQAFRKVDFDYPLTVAKYAKANGVCCFALNSALGANPQSSVFYSKTKGEVEAAIQKIGFPCLTIVRPGIIDGDRNEFRLAEKIALSVTKALHRLLPRRYRAVHADRIASVLLASAIKPCRGTVILESEDI